MLRMDTVHRKWTLRPEVQNPRRLVTPCIRRGSTRRTNWNLACKHRGAGGRRMQHFSHNLSHTNRNLIGTLSSLIPSHSTSASAWRNVVAVSFRCMARVVVLGVVSVAVLASLAGAQIAADLPNPSTAPNPLTATLSLFRSNMQDKIMKA